MRFYIPQSESNMERDAPTTTKINFPQGYYSYIKFCKDAWKLKVLNPEYKYEVQLLHCLSTQKMS